MSWSATVRRVRAADRPLDQRVTALHSLLANYHAPLGFTATRKRLRKLVGVGLGRRWTEPKLLRALEELEASRKAHLRYRSVFAERRRAEKAEGRRQPTLGDVQALLPVEWRKDAQEAARRHASRRERRRAGSG